MKGVVFTELIEMVEDQLGTEVADRMIQRSGVPNEGAYTAVGTYPHAEVLSLVGALSAETGLPPSNLVRMFGKHLFKQFAKACPQYVQDIHSTKQLMGHLDSYIHVEVRKLDPNAELPSFACQELPGGGLEVVYRSQRPFADLAEGLLAASIDHFHDDLVMLREDLDDRDGRAARFVLHALEAAV